MAELLRRRGTWVLPLAVAVLGLCSCAGAAPPPSVVPGPAGTLVLARGGAGEYVDVNLVSHTLGTTIKLPGAPEQSVISSDGVHGYSLDTDAGRITEVDFATHSVVTTASVGKLPVDIALSPNGRTLYVVDNLESKILVLDAATLKQTGSIITPAAPASLSLSPDGTTGLLSTAESPGAAGTMTSVNLTTDKAGYSFKIGKGQAESASLAPDDKTAWVLVGGQQAAGQLLPLNLSANTTGTAITVGSGAVDMVLNQARTQAVVVNALAATVTPINLGTGQAGAAVSLPEGLPNGINLLPGSSTAWVADALDNRLIPFSLVSDSFGTPIPLVEQPAGVDLVPSGSSAWVLYQSTPGSVARYSTAGRLLGTASVGSGPALVTNTTDTICWVINSLSDTAQSFNPTTGRLGPVVHLAHAPSGGALTPNGETLVVTSTGDGIAPGTVTVVDTKTNRVTATLTVGVSPADPVISPSGKAAVVANFTTNTVSLLNLTTNTVTASLAVGKGPDAVAVTSDSNYALIGGSQDGTITLVNLATGVAETPEQAADSPFLVSGPSGDLVYLVSSPDHALIGLSLPTLDTGTAVTLSGNTVDSAVTPNGKTMVLLDNENDKLGLLTLPNGRTVTAVALAGRPDAVAVNPQGTVAYVLLGERDEVVPFTLASRHVGTSISVGPIVSDLVVMAN